jgi:outer membrane protein assembly factor BamB
MNKPAILVMSICALMVFGSVGTFGASNSGYWPTWRGPDRTGMSPKGNPPLMWSETENIKWKVKLTGDGSNSSPIIWENRIFFQTAVKTDVKGTSPTASTNENSGGRGGPGGSPPSNVYKFNLVCLDRSSGQLLWQKTVREVLPHEGHRNDHGFASYSPVTDGKLVWANFGSRGVFCFDMDGNMKWDRDLGLINTVMQFGEGGSLAVAGDTVIVVRDQEGDSLIYALNKQTGKTIWKQTRDERTSWATPLPIEVNGKIQVVTTATNLIRSYDLETGEIIWQSKGLTRNAIPSPVAGMGMVYCTSGYRGSALLAVELGHTGDLTGTDAIKWQVSEATPYVPSPLLYEGRIYVISVNTGVISCYDAKTGKPCFFKEKLEQINQIYASPAGAGGRVYVVGRNGVTCILKSSGTFEVLAVNKLDDPIDCSPAFVGDELYLKGKEYLYCIAE